MAKLSKSILKEIVKECIVEIFEESFFQKNTAMMSNSHMNEMINENRSTRKTKTSKKQQRPVEQSGQRSRSTHLDNIRYGSEDKSSEKPNPTFERNVDKVVSTMSNDPVMSEIFKDTARTTLQEQKGAESGRMMSQRQGDAAARQAFKSDPEDLFGSAAGKWAQLAFSDPVK